VQSAKISLSSGAASHPASAHTPSIFTFFGCVCSLVRSVCLEVGPGIFRACDAAGRARLSPRLPILISGGILFALLSTGKGADELAGEHARMLSRSSALPELDAINQSICRALSSGKFPFLSFDGCQMSRCQKNVICFSCSVAVTSRSMPALSFLY
jgi:hypothetical protein